ncbi:hypothetical protein [Novosphingobium terrae]|uniref:hypothetical protein n=1 Tax=Novosphingobium terrae TaxID=2726189 RepID=UPI001980FE31|nr:hypothetical protein [Novosphingobium terrae]
MTSLTPASPISIPTLSPSLTVKGVENAGPDGNRGWADASALQISVAQPPDITTSDMYRQWQAQAALSQDTKALANAIGAAFQAIIADRPDLADAHFDFTSDDGKLKVEASGLGDTDRQWLEQRLNSDTGLVGAVGMFNADLGHLLGVNAETAVDDTAATAAKIDGSVHFLAMMQGVVNKAGQTGWLSDATYTDGQGQGIDLAQARTDSLSGMIDAKRQLDALQDGSVVTRLANGHVLYGAQVNPDPWFEAGIIAPAFVSSHSVSSAKVAGGHGLLIDRLI